MFHDTLNHHYYDMRNMIKKLCVNSRKDDVEIKRANES